MKPLFTDIQSSISASVSFDPANVGPEQLVLKPGNGPDSAGFEAELRAVFDRAMIGETNEPPGLSVEQESEAGDGTQGNELQGSGKALPARREDAAVVRGRLIDREQAVRSTLYAVSEPAKVDDMQTGIQETGAQSLAVQEIPLDRSSPDAKGRLQQPERPYPPMPPTPLVAESFDTAINPVSAPAEGEEAEPGFRPVPTALSPSSKVDPVFHRSIKASTTPPVSEVNAAAPAPRVEDVAPSVVTPLARQGWLRGSAPMAPSSETPRNLLRAISPDTATNSHQTPASLPQMPDKQASQTPPTFQSNAILLAPALASYPVSTAQPVPVVELQADPRLAPQIETAIDQIADTKQAARTARPEILMRHGDFGLVSMRLDAPGGDLRATLAARDPGFVPAVQNALAERATLAVGDNASGSNQRGSEQSPQPGAGSNGSGHGQPTSNGFSQNYGSSTGSSQGSSQPRMGQHGGEARGDAHRADDIMAADQTVTRGLGGVFA